MVKLTLIKIEQKKGLVDLQTVFTVYERSWREEVDL